MPFELYMGLRKVYFGADYVKRGKNAPTEDEEPEEHYQMKSLLNIVADSGVVETYMISKHEMGYLAIQLQN